MITVSDEKTDDKSTNALTQTISCIDIQRYSSLEKAIRVTAYVMRFIQNIRNSKDKRSIGFISVEERCKALKVLIMTVQQETFKDEIESLNSSSQKKVPLGVWTKAEKTSKFLASKSSMDALFDSKEKSFSKTPVSDWKNLPLIVKRHESSTQHQGCVVSSSEYLRIMENKSSSIASMISTSYKTNVATNRHVLEKIIEVILLCGRQNIPLRGHVEERSNFMAILHEKAKADNILSDHLAFSAASRAKYTSPDIQNELVELCGTEVLNQVIGACKSASCFAVIADECTDKATKEQMSLCLRVLDVEKNNTVIIREEFVGFRHAESVKGAAISDLIVRFLADLELDINKIRAQCYDGAANMAGKYSGVQARILQLNPEANYIHCKAHALNLALIHSSKDVCVRNMMSTVQEIAFSFDYSAKRLLAFSEELSDNQNVKEQLDRRTKLRTLCETRWSSRADSLFTFLNAFPVVVSSLEALKDDRDDKAAQYVNAILKFDFMIALVVAEHLLSATVALTNYLQKTDINLLDAVQEARIVVQRLDNERTDPNVWTALFEKAVKVGGILDSSI
ncbi:unnamed protein product [Mytilus edulis]|uniref:DUF4371 domain-containing protein n=1 Tax=Mytilus edulis TaxID=6550 RepID=A0A8S3S5K1_MYTED|nr:unnamed protein product [Mytilus edulis]